MEDIVNNSSVKKKEEKFCHIYFMPADRLGIMNELKKDIALSVDKNTNFFIVGDAGVGKTSFIRRLTYCNPKVIDDYVKQYKPSLKLSVKLYYIDPD